LISPDAGAGPISPLIFDGHNDTLLDLRLPERGGTHLLRVDTPIETVERHVDYLVERIGVERVGFGSDFDGAKIPHEIGDTSRLPKLLEAVHERGYDEAALEKLAHEN
jgi:microsomal dipeptidase-like Zn-dependent dipeptidase